MKINTLIRMVERFLKIIVKKCQNVVKTFKSLNISFRTIKKLLPPDKKNHNRHLLKGSRKETVKQNRSLRTKFMKFMKKKGDPFTPNKTV